MATGFSGGIRRCTQREPPLMGKQLERGITSLVLLILLHVHDCSGINLGDSCLQGDSDCTGDIAGSHCNTEKLCECTSNKYQAAPQSCAAKIALDNVCTAGVLGQCATADAECQVDTDNATKCLCKSTHFKDGSLCTLKIALDNVCTAGVLGQCATADAECQVDTDNATKCLCKSTHFKDGSLCTLKKVTGSDCKEGVDNQCSDSNAVCTNLKCTCKTTHYKNTANNNVCTEKKVTGSDCDEGVDNQCSDSNAVCANSKCTCKTTHYKNTGNNNVCTEKINLNGTCVDEADTPCSDDNARCASDGGANKCLCKDDYYPKNDSICYDKGIFDGSCTSTIGDTTCLYSLKCTGDKCQCANPATQFFDGTAKLCKTKINLNGTCVDEADTPCSDDNARCASDGGANKCLCKDDYYPKNDSICYDRIVHEEKCVKDGNKNQCIEDAKCVLGANNEYFCKCINGADNTGKCSSASVLAINVFIVVVSAVSAMFAIMFL